MSWTNAWEIMFRPDYKGRNIYFLWDQERIDELFRKLSDQNGSYVYTIEFDGECPRVYIIHGDHYQIPEILWQIYRCPMKITFKKNIQGYNIDAIIYYHPSRFEYELDRPIETRIEKVSETIIGNNDLFLYDKNTYSRENRIRLLADILYLLQYHKK